MDNRFYEDILRKKKLFETFNVNYIGMRDNLPQYGALPEIEKVKSLDTYKYFELLSLMTWQPQKAGFAVQDEEGIVYGISSSDRNVGERVLLSVDDERIIKKWGIDLSAFEKRYDDIDSLRDSLWFEYVNCRTCSK